MSTKRKAEGFLRAAERRHNMKSRNLRGDSERDSGFSDASSEQMSMMDGTDSEDPPRRTPSAPSQLAVMGGSYSNLSPMIIMNNVLLKQSVNNLPALKPWGFGPAMEVQQQPQVVFLQPMVSSQEPPTSKEPTLRHKRSKKYLPILNSYPKIAPHPGDSSSSGKGTASSSVCSSSGSEKCSTPNSKHWEPKQKERMQKSQPAGVQDPPLIPASPIMPVAIETSNEEKPSAPVITVQTDLTNTDSKDQSPVHLHLDVQRSDLSEHSGNSDTKRKRFCNTYNILSKSGLLDITLRTKELLRQNRRTQGDLDRLKEQTELFLRALQSGDSSICLKLQASLQEGSAERVAAAGLRADLTCAEAAQ